MKNVKDMLGLLFLVNMLFQLIGAIFNLKLTFDHSIIFFGISFLVLSYLTFHHLLETKELQKSKAKKVKI